MEHEFGFGRIQVQLLDQIEILVHDGRVQRRCSRTDVNTVLGKAEFTSAIVLDGDELGYHHDKVVGHMLSAVTDGECVAPIRGLHHTGQCSVGHNSFASGRVLVADGRDGQGCWICSTSSHIEARTDAVLLVECRADPFDTSNVIPSPQVLVKEEKEVLGMLNGCQLY